VLQLKLTRGPFKITDHCANDLGRRQLLASSGGSKDALFHYTAIKKGCKVSSDVNYTTLLKSITFTEQENTKVLLSPVQQLCITWREDKRSVKVPGESPLARIGGGRRHLVKLLIT
jgi:hypothetical protein